MKKILIVDDAPDTVTFLSAWLEDHGFETCSASDGSQGMHAILSERPDLVLMDLKMPNKTGVQLYREIRTSEACNGLPVIFITGMADLRIFDSECQLLPEPDGFIEKPFDLDVLRTAIDKALA